MFEFGLGVILAVLFVGAYLLITNFLRRERHELGGLPPAVTLNPVDSTHSIGTGKSRQALTSGELSKHHSGGARRDEGAQKGPGKSDQS
jgi:hypothetical protein